MEVVTTGLKAITNKEENTSNKFWILSEEKPKRVIAFKLFNYHIPLAAEQGPGSGPFFCVVCMKNFQISC